MRASAAPVIKCRQLTALRALRLLLATQRWYRRLAGARLPLQHHLLLQHHPLLLVSHYTSKRPCEPAPVSACGEVWSQTAVTKHGHSICTR